MAMIDYGAIAFKNGKLISTGEFTPMKDMVGWEDSENDICRFFGTGGEYTPMHIKGNYFAYIGDKDCTIAFYKSTIVIVYKHGDVYWGEIEILNSTGYTWSKWTGTTVSNWNGINIYDSVVVTKRNGYYVCRWNYKGDKYKVYFGYGVDFDSYKDYRIVNYYRSIPYLWNQLKWNLEKLKWKIEKIISNRRTKWK